MPTTSSSPSTGPSSGSPVSPDDRELADAISALFRAFAHSRERLRVHALTEGLDWSAFAALKPVVETGPQRVSTLADTLHLTPSTVSRLVTHLIAEGLVERQADAEDGRACLVAPTTAGLEAYERLRRVRQTHLAAVLADWSPQDRADLARTLHRLALSVERHADHPTSMGLS